MSAPQTASELFAEAEALMVQMHEAEDAGMKDLARFYEQKSALKWKEAEDALQEGR